MQDYSFMKDMASILKQPVKKGKDVFIAPNATVIGRVTLGEQVSVWFGAVLRADADEIRVGDRSNIQDNAVIHCDPGAPAIIGHDCIIGHLALVHGATLGDHVLVGMNSTILNHAKVGDYCIIGANALITAGTEIPPYSMVLGSPAKVVKQLNEEQIEKIKQNAEVYVQLAKEYLNHF
jgi:carbonic anhydrase/acetyltransferase-like protein (isoleucine patch superfamily)